LVAQRNLTLSEPSTPPTLPQYHVQHVGGLDDPGIPVFSEPVKVFIAGDDVIRLGFSGAFEDAVVFGIFRDDVQGLGGRHAVGDLPHDPLSLPDPVFRPGELLPKRASDFLDDVVGNREVDLALGG
jgi:hypothetical protein